MLVRGKGQRAEPGEVLGAGTCPTCRKPAGESEPLLLTTGGIVSNSGIALARLGMRVAAFTYVGNDEWADVSYGLRGYSAVQAWAKHNDRPILLGEFGAYDKGPMESRVKYTAAVARASTGTGSSRCNPSRGPTSRSSISRCTAVTTPPCETSVRTLTDDQYLTAR
jgi:hypothetical protein